uniref:Mitochondrial Rho GTPase 1-like n=1 Tax=Tanacetum cinerariifolium TaxID=118510 RepID=A0A6L2NEQ6_TANCI|nr:mitochondrial Rho GTPase 1-like [Tanacetum cinerariifolium]
MCSRVSQIWRKIWGWWNLDFPVVFPSFSIGDLAAGSIATHGCPRSKKILYGVLWRIWKWRNKVVNANPSEVPKILENDVFPAIQRVSKSWISAHFKSNDVNWNCWIQRSKEIAGLMLMTMEPEHEEGQSVSSYVVKMKGYIDNLEHLGLPVTLGLGLVMEGVDRINELRDEILVNNIMSRLDCTTKELIRTTATISKRWKNLWTQLPHLIFSNRDDDTYFGNDDTVCDYISFVDNTLNQCPANLNLKRFKLYINYINIPFEGRSKHINYYSVVNSEFKLQANRWIRYAISRNVEDVDLWLHLRVGQEEFTFEDEIFFKTSCITRMTLSYFRFNPPNGAISWERLECLFLYNVALDEDMIEKILSGSPFLESLELKKCHGYRRIDVTSRSVKKLVFSDYYYRIYGDYIDCIKINAPYISSLTINGYFELDPVLLDVSSLIKAELDYSIDAGMSDDTTYEEMLRGLLESLDHVKDVIINDFWWEIYSHLKAHGDISNVGIDCKPDQQYTWTRTVSAIKVRCMKEVKCFNAPLQPSEIVVVKRVVQDKLPEGVNEHGLRTPVQSVELTSEVLDFLRVFITFDVDGDDALNEQEPEDVFSTAPESPWSEAPYANAAETNVLGGMSFDGFLSQWALMTLLNPVLSVENLVYIGYVGDLSSACFVFGPKEAGKSSLLDSFVGKPFSEVYTPTTEERYTVNMVDQPYRINKTLILREIPEDAIEKLLVNKEALGACDMAVFVHDSSKEASWIRATELLVQVASHGESNGYEVLCLIVAAKDDLEPYPNAIEALTGVSQHMGIQALYQ